MLADGDVYENKLYKHTKMLQNLTFKRLPESVTSLCNPTDMLWKKDDFRMLEMQKRGSSIMSYNLRLEDMMDKSVQHSH